jgi:transcriptional regulator with XRE-family HTH domain
VPRNSNSDRQQKQVLSRLGENIRRERRRLGLPQGRLAGRVALRPRVLQKMESGGSSILATTPVRIQTAPQCPWDLRMANLGADESVNDWLRRMEGAKDPDWLVYMRKVQTAWGNRDKPSPGKMDVPK